MQKDKTLAYVNLHAVLPALCDLAAKDDKARAIAAKSRGSVMLAVPGGPCAVLTLDGKGGVSFSKEPKLAPKLGLAFPTPKILNDMFAGKKAFPIPYIGVWNVGLIKTFTELTKRLDEIMKDSEGYVKEHPEELGKVLSILFGIAMRGLEIVAERDHKANHYIAAAPQGVAAFKIGSGADRLNAAFTIKNGRLSLSFAEPAACNAELSIPKFEDAMALFNGKMDAMAAVGLGVLSMKGHLLMLDQINASLDVLGGYLKP